MADLTKTITNTVSVNGPSPASTWGTMVWGDGFWGETKDTRVDFGKWLSESVVITTRAEFSFSKVLQNALGVSSSIDLISLTDGAGYTYVLQGGATDPSNRYFPSYTADVASSVSYTARTPSSPSWGAA